jgi:hypothetical protein
MMGLIRRFDLRGGVADGIGLLHGKEGKSKREKSGFWFKNTLIK